LGEYRSFSLMCLTYNIGSRKTRSKNAIYHRLTKLSNSTPLRTQCAWDPQEDLTGVVTWAEKDLRKRSGLINLGNVELFSQVTREQSTKAPINNEVHLHYKP